MQDYVPPSRKTNCLEPDLAYVGADINVVSATEGCHLSNPSRGSSSQEEAREVVCFRCGNPGHRALGCAVKAEKFCYRCKKEGCTVKTCPHCRN